MEESSGHVNPSHRGSILHAEEEVCHRAGPSICRPEEVIPVGDRCLKVRLGTVLQQMQEDGKYHLVAYASHALRGSEANYHSSKLEFLALKWAVTKQFKEYLMYQLFTVCTDNNPLTYILTMPNLDATGHCWVSALARFNFS